MNEVCANDLKRWFNQHGNTYLNAAGMRLGMDPDMGNRIWTSFDLYTYDESHLSIGIYTEYDLPEEFPELFRVETLADLEKLGYNNSWMRYLNGLATITVNPIELDAELAFRIHYNKTTVSCLEMHFYDEVNEHLTLPEDFPEYVNSRESYLQRASENRYKWR